MEKQIHEQKIELENAGFWCVNKIEILKNWKYRIFFRRDGSFFDVAVLIFNNREIISQIFYGETEIKFNSEYQNSKILIWRALQIGREKVAKIISQQTMFPVKIWKYLILKIKKNWAKKNLKIKKKLRKNWEKIKLKKWKNAQH